MNRIASLFKRKEKEKPDRYIRMDGKVTPIIKVENIVHNQKYSILTFVPIVLFNQFKYFFNFFFLLITLSQLFPPLKVGFTITYVAPLVFVLSLTMIKEAYDDFKRYRRDKEANSQLFRVLKGGMENFIEKPSSDLQVGDIIEINANQRIPADCVLLWTNDPSDSIFLRTDQLDGETDWKLRNPIHYTQEYMKKNPKKSIYFIEAELVATPPNEHIYKFDGLFKVDGSKHQEALGLENTLWCSTVLATGRCLAMVIFTGLETRIAMNSREATSKAGELDKELDFISKVLFVGMGIAAASITFLEGSKTQVYIEVFRQFLLLSSIIPISLRVNLDFSKMIYSVKIGQDPDIPDALARNSQIPEELGRVQYILTDKTGTLTQNEMVFKKLTSEYFSYDETKLETITTVLKAECSKTAGPMSDIEEKMSQILNSGGRIDRSKRLMKRSKNFVLRDMVTALVLCHNVTPIIDGDVKTFQASSPDEIALVKLAESVGLLLNYRDQKTIIIQTPAGKKETYKILENFPFTSESKRMGILLQHEETKKIIFYLKGADSIMKSKIQEYSRAWMLEECETLAMDGLRTLVISQKLFRQEEYEQWKIEYLTAQADLKNRANKSREVIEKLENSMELLGLTGVEDKLQIDVCSVIDSLRKAGIAVWMLTGDKIETASCIAISAGFKRPTEEFFVIRDIDDPHELVRLLNDFDNELSIGNNSVLVIDGASLKVALERNSDLFFRIATQAESVICCRCAPTQKAQITEGIKLHTKKKTLGIGDGGNDVGMIQKADVGVGIVGKEGKQAALASDFSIMRFKDLSILLLWHGRNAYKRTAVMANFVIHRGMIISVIQYLFSTLYFGVAIPIYNGWLMLGYSTIFTMFPVFALIFDEDVTKPIAKQYPELYKSLQKGRELNMKMFLIWVFKSVYQGGMIMIMATILFKESFVQLVSITFTCLIISELLNIMVEVSKLSLPMIIAQSMTVLAYFSCIFFLQDMFMVSSIDMTFVTKVGILTGFSWLPMYLIKIIYKRLHPSQEMTIMRQSRSKRDDRNVIFRFICPCLRPKKRNSGVFEMLTVAVDDNQNQNMEMIDFDANVKRLRAQSSTSETVGPEYKREGSVAPKEGNPKQLQLKFEKKISSFQFYTYICFYFYF